MIRSHRASTFVWLAVLAWFAVTSSGVAQSPPHRTDFAPLSDVVVFDGLNHSPLGAAQLDVVGDELIVSNLESGGGGVVVQLGQARGWGFSFDDLDIEADPVGAFKEWTMRGMVEGVPDQVTWVERHEVAEVDGRNVIQVSFDTSALGATANVLEVYEDGELVYEGVHPSGPIYHFFAEHPNPPAMGHVAQWDATCVKMPIDPRNWPIKTESGVVIRDFDTIVTYPLDPVREVSFCSAVESRAEGLAEVALRDEVLVALGERLAHRTLGSARFNPVAERLGLTQLGGSGNDGVSIDLGSVDSVDLHLEPIDPMDVAPAGARLMANVYGTLDGQPDQSLGQLDLTLTAGGSVRVDADFSSISSPTHRVQVFNDGELVVDLPGHTGTAALASGWPDRLGKLGGQTECYVGGWPDGTEFDIDGLTYVGDELRVLAETSGANLGDKSAFELRVADLPRLTLVDERLDTQP